MAKCFQCGTETAETWRFCSKRREFVCINCERACPHYSRNLLPNSCNCRLTYVPENYYKYLCSTEEYKSYREKYMSFNIVQLRGRFGSLKESYRIVEDASTRSTMRAELAALKDLIQERWNTA